MGNSDPRSGYDKFDWTYKTWTATGAQSDEDVWAAPGAGISIHIYAIEAHGDGSGATLRLTEGADGAATRILYIGSEQHSGSYRGTFPFEAPLVLAANTALKVTTTGAGINFFVM